MVLRPRGGTRPDGTKLMWQTVNVGPGRRGSLFPFLIADSTPRENRAYPSGKPTTDRFGGIGKVVVGVHDLEGAVAQYRMAFRLPAPLRQKDATFGAELAWFEGTPSIVLATGSRRYFTWLSQRVSEYGDAPAAFILTAAAGSTGSPYPTGSAIPFSGWTRRNSAGGWAWGPGDSGRRRCLRSRFG